MPGTGIRTDHGDATNAPGRIHRARPAGGAQRAARGSGLGARNQARWVSAGDPPRRREGASVEPQRGRLHRRMPTIAAGAAHLKAESFTIDGEAVVIGADGLSRFDELRRAAGARVAFLYAFDLLEFNGEDLREQPLLARRKVLATLLRRSQDGIVFNEHIAEEGAVVFAHACRLGAEGIVSKRVDAPYRSGPHPAWVKVRNPASIAVQRERSEYWNK
jgi:bifunctional non-homologous end joining protein LigD